MTDAQLLHQLAARITQLEARVAAAPQVVAATVISVDDDAGTAVVEVQGVETTITLPDGFRPSVGDTIMVSWVGGVLVPTQIPAGSIPGTGLADGAVDSNKIKPGTIVPDDGQPPAAPTGLTVDDGVRSLFVTWDPNTESDMVDFYGAYELQWATTSNFSGAATVRSSTAWITLTGLTTEVTYYLRVRAVDANGQQSGWSTSATGVPLAIQHQDIATYAVQSTNIANGSISTPKLTANSVGTNQLQAGAVSAGKIAANAVTAEKVAADAITADKLDATSLQASSVIADSITGKTVTGVVVSGGTLKTAATGQKVEITPDFNDSGVSAAAVVFDPGTGTAVGYIDMIHDGTGGSFLTLKAPGNSGTVLISDAINLIPDQSKWVEVFGATKLGINSPAVQMHTWAGSLNGSGNALISHGLTNPTFYLVTLLVQKSDGSWTDGQGAQAALTVSSSGIGITGNSLLANAAYRVAALYG